MRKLTGLLIAGEILFGGEHFMTGLLNRGLPGDMGAATGIQANLENPASGGGRGVVLNVSPGYRGFGLRGAAMSLGVWGDPRFPVLHIISEHHEFMVQNSFVMSSSVVQDSLYAMGFSMEYYRLHLLDAVSYRQLYLNSGMEVRLMSGLLAGFTYRHFLKLLPSELAGTLLKYPEYGCYMNWQAAASLEVFAALSKQDIFPMGWRVGFRRNWRSRMSTAMSYDSGKEILMVSLSFNVKAGMEVNELFLWHTYLRDLHAFSFFWAY